MSDNLARPPYQPRRVLVIRREVPVWLVLVSAALSVLFLVAGHPLPAATTWLLAALMNLHARNCSLEIEVERLSYEARKEESHA